MGQDQNAAGSADVGRIPRLSIEDTVTAAEEVGAPTYIADLNVFGVLFHNPPLASAFNDVLMQLLMNGTLDARLRELVIMRIGWVTGSEYEWAQHWRIGPQLGASQDDMAKVRDWESSDLGVPERAILAATDEALTDGAVSAGTWKQCEEHVGGNSVLLEMLTVIGLWKMVSIVAKSVEIPIEEGVESWGPDGIPPASAG